MQETKPRPAYVQFEVRAVEDRSASVEAGRYVPKDVIFAIVTPAGTKDRIEKEAEAWLESIREVVNQGRIPPEWLDAYEQSLERFKQSRENPTYGSSIKNWPAVSPAEVKILLDCNILSIEDLAEANEEAINRIGMGGRALKQRAQAWLDAASGEGKFAAELETLRQENSDLKRRDEEREARLEQLERTVKAFQGSPTDLQQQVTEAIEEEQD